MKKLTTAFALACMTTFLAALPALAENLEITPITDSAGNPPKVVRVELQHEVLKEWAGLGGKPRPIIVFSDILGLYRPQDESEIKTALGDLRAGRWDKALSKPYPTPTYPPVNIGNYIYYLVKLGVVNNVYWVPPMRGSVGGEPMENLKGYMSMLGASDEELAGFKQEAHYIRGTVNGVPLHISGLGDLAPPISDSLLVIDVNFLNTLYLDEVREPMLDLFANFAGTLSGCSPRVSHAAVVNTTAFDAVPLERRFLGSYLVKFLSDPKSLRESPPETWLIRAGIMYNDTFFQSAESLELCRKAVEVAPDDPDARYDLALGYFGVKDMDPMIDNLVLAVGLDRGYYPAYMKYAEYFSGKGFPGASQYLLEKAAEAVPGDPRIMESRHRILLQNGEYKEAAQTQKSLIEAGFDNADNHAALADDYVKAGDFKRAVESYRKALSMVPVMGDPARPKYLLGIATAYEGAKMLDEAEKAYKDAIASATDDDLRHGIQARYDKFTKDWAPFRGRPKSGR